MIKSSRGIICIKQYVCKEFLKSGQVAQAKHAERILGLRETTYTVGTYTNIVVMHCTAECNVILLRTFSCLL